MSKNSHKQRAAAAASILFVAIVLGVGVVTPAYAFAGQELLTWAGDNIIFPLGIVAVVFSLAAALFRPDMLKNGIWAAVICAIIYFLIRSAPSLQSAIQAG
jgi:uncharacterized membrane protein YvlD (DUF360 family)